ncbi:uncharacterized protein BX664DRAFT_255135, partial [Halteromyces radiatus]|uniref:uncharacterized protein n=1 Tax=Halteromyces radiatus TaxID=101107 RepID=UPI00221F26F3
DTGTDDISTDEKVRNASRSFRQTFDIPMTERLVNCKLSKIKFIFFFPLFNIYIYDL